MRFLHCAHAEFLLVVPRLTRTRLGIALLALGTTLVWLSAHALDALTVTLQAGALGAILGDGALARDRGPGVGPGHDLRDGDRLAHGRGCGGDDRHGRGWQLCVGARAPAGPRRGARALPLYGDRRHDPAGAAGRSRTPGRGA